MDNNTQQRLLEFLKSTFDQDGTIHFLAVSASELARTDQTKTIRFRVRIALTFHDGDSIIPYFDGTDIFVEINPTAIQFTHEDEWADGPPIMEGSPIELALPWVSEMAPPFFISPEAHEA